MTSSERVACTLHYSTHSDGYESTALLFAISKARARAYCQEVCLLLQHNINQFIHLLTTCSEWRDLRNNFYAIAGFPNCYGALDGWYSRKGFTAFNLQAVVDSNLKYMSKSIRSGSQNDKALFNNSQLGKTCHRQLPAGGCLVADAGYKLQGHIMTPYVIHAAMSPSEALYNFQHSRTRIAVERSFGIWKSKFRVFKSNLLQADLWEMAMIIEATIVLHNLFIDNNSDED
ncbi:hypothetical protein THRCLA_22017 [Thraustotheca clavata]|uniref:DDE Tnp4 domain-containing protein n=1 Tax=Thraustotheca clavata TaxID=74557 RepID=A0A1V9ZDY3_9STRA|nr:hypothetical protein THRCLA_22017 [Thraustotheca clavata]